MTNNICLMIILILMSIDDIRHKSISLVWTVIAVLISIILVAFTGNTGISSAIWGCTLGIVLTTFIHILKLKIGIGDCVCFIIIGILKGIMINICVVVLSLLTVSVFCSLMLILKKVKRNTEIPFIPFIAIASMEVILCA